MDVGCGSGRDAKVFLEAGYQVTAMDASEKMCEEAEKFLNSFSIKRYSVKQNFIKGASLGQSVHASQKVICLPFEEMNFQKEFDGIWACASLLHVSGERILSVMKRCRNALKENGVLYASFKYGEGERVVKGRFFRDYREDSLRELMAGGGFSVVELFISEDVRAGREGERWINVLARKSMEGHCS